MYKLLVLLLLTLSLFSCSADKKNDTNVSEITVDKDNQESISAPSRELEDSIISINEATGEQ